MRRLIFLLLIVVCLVAIFYSGCSKKDDDEPTKNADQSQSAKMSEKTAAQHKPAAGNISDNPAFSSTSGTALSNDVAKDIDSIIMPVLKKTFGNVKIIAESKAPEIKIDGEVVENRITYVVKQLLTPQDGTPLHSAFTAAGFKTSPRLGRKPTIWSHGATMSLFKSTSKRGYSLVINVDTDKQQIVVESYKLGSKSDRM
jgi:hypothetical protein